jgi:hypothetical protein
VYHSQLHFLQSPLSSSNLVQVSSSASYSEKNISLYPSCSKKYKVLYPLKPSCITILQHLPCGHVVRRKTKDSESNCSKRSQNIIFFYFISHAILIL